MHTFPQLSYACPIPWSSLSGDEKSKFCQKCGRSITNFSELSEEARRTLLANSGHQELCITYYRRLSGEFVTPENPLTPEERSRIKQLGIAVLSAGALALAAGCVSTPAHPKEEPKKETQTTKPLRGDEPIVLQAFGVMTSEPSKRK
jgi:hypothetical protein